MSNKTRAVWLYCVAASICSIVLIVVAAMSQTHPNPRFLEEQMQTKDQMAFSQTLEQSLSAMSEQNMQLQQQLTQAKETIALLEEEGTENKVLLDQAQQAANNQDLLIKAVHLYHSAQYSSARQTLASIDRSSLSQTALPLYTLIKEKLVQKGFSF